MLATALAGALIAISFSAPPGPVTLETVRRGLRGGFRPALFVQLGSIIGDVTWCGLALLGLAPLVQVAPIRAVLSVAGVAVLVCLGTAGVREALAAGVQLSVATEGSAPEASAFRGGLAISMANPMAAGYWLSVGGALVASGLAGATAAQTAAFVAGFTGGALAWAFLLAGAVRWGKLSLSPAMFRWVHLGCGAILLVFGVSLAVRMFGALL
ncbi:MAG: LysE family transporter [Anaerolineales bacterium]|nr:LysE family transporter [Anaerolineales bacterium]